MTELDDHEAAIGLQAIFGRVEFDASSNSPGDGGDGGNQAGLAPVASASYVHRLTDRLRFGMGFFSISGSILDPNDGWQGRFEVTEISLLTMSVSPTLAYRVNDWLSVGGGPIITYGRLEWDLKVPVPGEPKAKIDVDDVRAAARAGIFLKPHEDLDVGVYYPARSRRIQLAGDGPPFPAGHLRLGGLEHPRHDSGVHGPGLLERAPGLQGHLQGARRRALSPARRLAAPDGLRLGQLSPRRQ
jgi:long-chain fatty acid transport protein